MNKYLNYTCIMMGEWRYCWGHCWSVLLLSVLVVCKHRFCNALWPGA